jgi:Fe2+ transport system protein FeoA
MACGQNFFSAGAELAQQVGVLSRRHEREIRRRLTEFGLGSIIRLSLIGPLGSDSNLRLTSAAVLELRRMIDVGCPLRLQHCDNKRRISAVKPRWFAAGKFFATGR